MFRQYGHRRHDQRHLAIAAGIEYEAYRQIRHAIRTHDLLVRIAMVRTTPLAQRLHRKNHVVGGDRFAVREPRRGIEMKRHRRSVRRHLHGLGNEAVHRERLVEPARHERLVNPLANTGDGFAADDERVECIERSRLPENDTPSLRRVRIGVIEMGEACRVFRRAMHRNGMRTGVCEGSTGQHRYRKDHGSQPPLRAGSSARTSTAPSAATGATCDLRICERWPRMNVGHR